MNNCTHSKRYSVHLYWCQKQSQVWVEGHLETISGSCFTQMCSDLLPQDNSHIVIKSNMLISNLCKGIRSSFYCHRLQIQRTVFQMQTDPGLMRTGRFPRVLDYRELCLYNEPRMNCVVMNCCCFLFKKNTNVGFSFTPSEDQRHGAFECCHSCSKANKPFCPLNQIMFGLVNVYCDVYSHGYQMFNLFSSH